MEINGKNITGLYTSFNASFQEGLRLWNPDHEAFTMTIPSTGRVEDMGWLQELPSVRRWIGDRVVQNVVTRDYKLENEDHELTVEVKRNDIEDDQYGHYSNLFRLMGQRTAQAPGFRVYEQLAAGETALCYDGTPFFNDAHPNGPNKPTYSNLIDGVEEPWYLLDGTQAVSPMIFQRRRAFEMVMLTSPTDTNVFHQKKYVYGVDGRYTAGYGFPQLAAKNKGELNFDTFDATRTLLRSIKDSDGKALATTPNILLVGPSNQTAAEEIAAALLIEGGNTNVRAGSVQVIVSNVLAA